MKSLEQKESFFGDGYEFLRKHRGAILALMALGVMGCEPMPDDDFFNSVLAIVAIAAISSPLYDS